MLNRSIGTIGLFGLALTLAACGNHTAEKSDGGSDDAGIDSGTAGSSAGHGGSTASAGRSGSGSAGKAGSSANAGRGGSAGKAGAGGKSAAAGSGGKAHAGSGGSSAAGGGGASGNAGAAGSAAGAGGEVAGESGTAGGVAGAGGDAAGTGGSAGDAQAGSGEAGAAGASAGASGSDAGAAGSAGGAGGSSGVPVAGTTELSDLSSADQATTVCGEVDTNVTELDWHGAGVGYCSLLGVQMDPNTCTTSRDACVNANTDPTPPCSIDSIPKCTDVTVDEFVNCRTDYLMGFVQYYNMIDCTTDPTSLQPQAVPGSCTGPYMRCPQLMP